MVGGSGRVADVPKSAGGGAVLDSGWEERARRQAAAVESHAGTRSTRSAAAAAEPRANIDGILGNNQNESETTTRLRQAGEEEAVIDITTPIQWKDAVLSSTTGDTSNGGTRPLVVKFTASWCTPCKKIDPYYLMLAQQQKKKEKVNGAIGANFFRVDVDELDELAQEFEVDIMPTFVVLVSGKEVGRVKGASESKLEALVTEHCTRTRSTELVADKGDSNDKEEAEDAVKEDGHSKINPPADLVSERIADDDGDQQQLQQQQNETTEQQQQKQQQTQQQTHEPERPPLKSSADHPGLSEFHAYYGAISDLYRQYIVGTKDGDVEPAPIIPRSERGNVRLQLEVLNSTTLPVDVFWVDYMGREEWKGSAAPGSYWTQTTWVGHPWTFRAQGGQVLLHYVPYRIIPTTDKAVTVTRNGDAIHRFTILSPSYSSTRQELACDVMDPIFPFPATKHKSVDRSLEWCYRQMERDGTNPRTVLKYLCNIARHPSEAKYRQIRTANRKFWNDVWCNAGRGVLHALGFQEINGRIEMGPAAGSLSADRVKQVVGAIRDLERLLEQMEGSETPHEQPEGADGYGRAGFGRIGMN